MSTERVTVSLPDDVRRAAQRIAEQRGTSFSAVVAEALTGWMRGRLVDAWLAEHQATHGQFEESELRALAVDAGVPYVGPGRAADSAA
jgi:predicted transcriptional regulator